MKLLRTLFNFQIEVSSFKEEQDCEFIYSFGKKITKNKCINFSLQKGGDRLLSINLRILLTGEDHAGISMGCSLFGRSIDFSVFDNRHWDYDKDTWRG